jgi:hypothetical protein
LNAEIVSTGDFAMSPRSLRLRIAPPTALLVAALLAGAQAGAAQVPAFAGDEIRVNTQPYLQSAHQVAVFPDGGFAVVWSAGDLTAPGRDVLHARFFGPDDAPLSEELLLLPPPPAGDGRQNADALLVDAAGNLLLIYEEGSSTQPFAILAQRFSRSGTLLGPRIEVSAPNPLGRSRAAAAFRPDGGFVVSWGAEVQATADSLTWDVYMRRFDAAGNPLAPEIRTLAGGALDSAVPSGVGVAPDGSFVLGYQQRDPATQLFAADGTPGRMSSVHYHGDFAAGYTQFVMAQDGSYVVAWTNYGVDSRLPPKSYHGPLPYTGNNAGVGARFFTPGGAPRGREFEVNRIGPGEQVLGGLAALPAGGFIAVWNDFSGRDGDGFDVYGRAFSASRRPLTPDLHLSQATTGNQFIPVAASNAAGDVVVVWFQAGDNFAAPQNLIARRLRIAAPHS